MKFLHYKDREKLNVFKTYREKRKNIEDQAPNNTTNGKDVWKTIRAGEYFPERVI